MKIIVGGAEGELSDVIEVRTDLFKNLNTVFFPPFICVRITPASVDSDLPYTVRWESAILSCLNYIEKEFGEIASFSISREDESHINNISHRTGSQVITAKLSNIKKL